MKASGKTASFTGKASRLCLMGLSSTASGSKVGRTAWVHASILITPSTLGAGSTDSLTAKESK